MAVGIDLIRGVVEMGVFFTCFYFGFLLRFVRTPEQSDYTSVKKRIAKAREARIPNLSQQQANGLFPFVGNPREPMPKGLPFKLTDYLELVDWSARMIREDKRGAMDAAIPPILTRLNIEPAHWRHLTTAFEQDFKTFIGQAESVKEVCLSLGYQRTPGIRACEQYFP